MDRGVSFHFEVFSFVLPLCSIASRVCTHSIISQYIKETTRIAIKLQCSQFINMRLVFITNQNKNGSIVMLKERMFRSSFSWLQRIKWKNGIFWAKRSASMNERNGPSVTLFRSDFVFIWYLNGCSNENIVVFESIFKRRHCWTFVVNHPIQTWNLEQATYRLHN